VAFSEFELKRIDKLVGGFCRGRSPAHLADQLRLVYEIDGQSVVLVEERPDWRDPSKRMRSSVAKLRFVRTTGRWTLYWKRADLTWHAYRPAGPDTDLAALVDVVDRDEYCVFFG